MNHKQFNLYSSPHPCINIASLTPISSTNLILPSIWFFLSFRVSCADINGRIQHPQGDEVVCGDCGASACSGEISRRWRTCTFTCHGCWDWISGDVSQWRGSAINVHLPRCASLALDIRSSCFLIDQYDWLLMVCMYMILSLWCHYFLFLYDHIFGTWFYMFLVCNLKGIINKELFLTLSLSKK